MLVITVVLSLCVDERAGYSKIETKKTLVI